MSRDGQTAPRVLGREDKLPPLRAVDVIPTQNDHGEPFFALHDLMGLARPLAVSAAGYFTLMHLDGQHSCADIQAVFRRQFGIEVPDDQLLGLVRTLDEALLLEGPRFEDALAKRSAAYRAAPTRSSRDGATDGAALATEVRAIVAGGVAAAVDDVRGLVAPHLDYRRGAPCYADAYATLARSRPADRYVILGTNHAGRATSAVATTKDFETPLGVARTDRGFITALERRLGAGLCACEDDHAHEHSVELQVHMLQALLDRPFEIVPVLCPSPCGPTGTAPYDGHGPDLDDFAEALGELAGRDGRRTILIAGADLSHVGARFGDDGPTTEDFLTYVDQTDHDALHRLETATAADFAAHLAETGNPTRICSTGCLYVLRRALAGRPLRVLRYHQAVDHAAETHVTCAAAVVS